MKKMYLLAVLIAASMPLASMAQDDDLYFNPKKEAKEKAEKRAELKRAYEAQRARRDSLYALYWSGSGRDVDEYNRGGHIFSHYENVGTDSLGNDIIQFRVGKGVAPDSIYDDSYFAQKYADQEEDFCRTRDISRWDGYYDPWFYDYYGYGLYYWRSRMWGWRNPWRYGYYAGWYDPWFDPWYDPWYYGYAGWYSGWYDPWYGWGGYYCPWYWGGSMIGHVSYGGNPNGYAGRRNWGFNGGNKAQSGWGSRGDNGRYTSRRGNETSRFGNRTTYTNVNNNSTTRSNSTFGSFNGASRSGGFGGGSFGGGHFGGGSFGGGRSGGGGFGGRR